jgi:hypothetical protein
MKRGYTCAGRFGRRKGSAWAKRLDGPMTKLSNVYLSLEARGRGGCFWLGASTLFEAPVVSALRDAGSALSVGSRLRGLLVSKLGETTIDT